MPKRTRRRFLEESMFAAAAAVAGCSAPQAVEAAKTERFTADEKLQVAVIGVRGRGKTHLGAFGGRTDTRIAWVIDADRSIGAKRTAEVARRQRGLRPKFSTEMTAAFDDPNVDIVSIATPDHWHAAAAIGAMRAGKDVYLENPVSHNVREGRLIVETSRKYQRVCQAGLQARSNPGMRDAMKFLRDGKIGKVTSAKAICYRRATPIGTRGTYEVPQKVDFDRWLGPVRPQQLSREQLHHHWHAQWEFGGGSLGYQGVHQMDVARWGLNRYAIDSRLFSCGGRFGWDDAGETPNTQLVSHTFDNQQILLELRSLGTSGHRQSKAGVIFQGTEGFLIMTTYYSGAAFDPSGKQIRAFNARGDHFGNFVDAVRSRRILDLNCDIEEGHLSATLCHLGNISYRTGVDLDEIAAIGEVRRLVSGNGKSVGGETVGTETIGTETVETFRQLLRHARQHVDKSEVLNVRVGTQLAFDSCTEEFVDKLSDQPVDHSRANELLSREYRNGFGV